MRLEAQGKLQEAQAICDKILEQDETNLASCGDTSSSNGRSVNISLLFIVVGFQASDCFIASTWQTSGSNWGANKILGHLLRWCRGLVRIMQLVLGTTPIRTSCILLRGAHPSSASQPHLVSQIRGNSIYREQSTFGSQALLQGVGTVYGSCPCSLWPSIGK